MKRFQSLAVCVIAVAILIPPAETFAQRFRIFNGNNCPNGQCLTPQITYGATLIDGQAIGVIGAKAFAVRESTIRAVSGITGHALSAPRNTFVGVACSTDRRLLKTCSPQRGRKVAQSIVKRNGMFYKTTVWR